MNFFRSSTPAPPAEAFQPPPNVDGFQDEDPGVEGHLAPDYALTTDEQVLIQTILDEEESYDDSSSRESREGDSFAAEEDTDFLGIQNTEIAPKIIPREGAPTSVYNLESYSQFSLSHPTTYQSTASSSRYSFVTNSDDCNAPLVVKDSFQDEELDTFSGAGHLTNHNSHNYFHSPEGPGNGLELEPFFLDEYSSSEQEDGNDGIFIHSTETQCLRWPYRRFLWISLFMLVLALILLLSIGLTNRDGNIQPLASSTSFTPTETPTWAPTPVPTSRPTVPTRIPLREGEMNLPLLRDGYFHVVSSENSQFSKPQVDQSLILTVSETVPYYFQSEPEDEGSISFLEFDWQKAYQRRDFDIHWIHQVRLQLTLSNRPALMEHFQVHNQTFITLYYKAYAVPSSWDENYASMLDVNEYQSNKVDLQDDPDWIPFQVYPLEGATVDIVSAELVHTLYQNQNDPSTWDPLRIILAHESMKQYRDPPVKFWSSSALEEQLRPQFIVNLQEPVTASPSISSQPSQSPLPTFVPSASQSPSSAANPSMTQTQGTYDPSLSSLPTNEDGVMPYCNFCGDMLPQSSNHSIRGNRSEAVLDILGRNEMVNETLPISGEESPLQCGTVREWLLPKVFSLTPRECSRLQRLVSQECCQPHPVCDMCLPGLQISNLTLEEVIAVSTSATTELTTIWTCEQYQQYSEKGKIPEGVCSALRESTTSTCCKLPL